MPTIPRETYPTARKEHVCEFCGEKIARELNMYDDCDDSGLDGKSFREELDSYVYANHYDEHTDDVYTGWRVNYYEKAKKILKELKKEE